MPIPKDKICKHCGQTFIKGPHYSQLFCSTNCWYTYMFLNPPKRGKGETFYLGKNQNLDPIGKKAEKKINKRYEND